MADLEQDLKDRMKRLGVNVIRLVECLPRQMGSEILGKQIIRCATSVGANYRAACRARSKADFVAKLEIAEEESDETMYWLEILRDLNLVEDQAFEDLHREAEEITRILVASIKTTKQIAPTRYSIAFTV